MEFDKVLNKRHSARRFKEIKKPDYQKVMEAIDASSKAPLAGNLPCLKYILVSDKKLIKELAEACQQEFIEKVHYIVVVCTDKKFLEKSYYERAEMYIRQEAGAAIENFLLKIVDLGLASCWVGAFSDETIKRILKIPDNIQIEALLPVGYEFEGTEKKSRPNLESTMYYDGWGFTKRDMTRQPMPLD
jgi:nitroreductase